MHMYEHEYTLFVQPKFSRISHFLTGSEAKMEEPIQGGTIHIWSSHFEERGVVPMIGVTLG